jgi:hypothetical protein
MRWYAALFAAALVVVGVQASQDEKKATPKGSPVVLIGCLSGTTLIVKNPTGADAVFALRASKERMKAIRKDFEHAEVEVVGFAHDTASRTSRGSVVTSRDGKNRVSVNATEEKSSFVPQPTPLDVESVKKTGGACR